MKDLRYLASVVVVLASIFFVGCGIDEQSNQVGENAAAENGDAQNGALEKAAPEKAAPGNDAAEDEAALRAIPNKAEPEQAVPDNRQFATSGGELTLENSRLSMSVPKGWMTMSNPAPELMLTMSSPKDSIKGHNPVVVILSFSLSIVGMDPFKVAKKIHERKSNIDSERMQKVAGRDALRLEMTTPDDDGNVSRQIVVTIPLDDCAVTISGSGMPDDMDAVKDQFDEIIDSIKLK